MWNRLEPRPRHNNFARSLRAEVRDAMWMLTRQWQLGEWIAEDTGTAAFARLDMQTSRINLVSKKNAFAALPFDETVPLECLVEREKVAPDLLLRAELGRQFLKFIRYKLTPSNAASIPTVETALRASTTLRFAIPASPPALVADYLSNPELWQSTLALSDGRGIDGYALLEYLKTPGNSVALLTGLTGNTTLAPLVNAAGTEFKAWYNRVYSQPATNADSYWVQPHLEYQFACSAPKSTTQHTVLTATEYYQGHLDWHSFDLQKNPSTTGFQALVADPPDTALLEHKPFNVVPSKIVYGGMPAQRWWEMEDRQIDFGGIEAAKTDTARLLVAEFGTIYSNDWTLLPYKVPTGSICHLRCIVVTDVFGQMTRIKASGAAAGNVWNMYTLSTAGDPLVYDSRLFIPPVIDKIQESEPIERVNFMRDEMANMVWAIETIVPDGVDGGESGVDSARRLTDYLESLVPGPVSPTIVNDAKVSYNVMSRVPENWIPFIPVRLGVSISRDIQLQRAAMPRVVGNLQPTERVRPRTSLLRDGYNATTNTWSRSYIYEEEVPRSGAVLSRTWQRARAESGRVMLWLGRRKQNGRGEGNSGLRFDYLTAK
jgi:hypothetical protein